MSERVPFSRLLEGLMGGHCIKNVKERLSVASKGFEKLVNNKIVDH